MDQDSVRRLRLDRRLRGRRGWISQKEFDDSLMALPDAADKVAPPEEVEEESAAVEGEAETREA